MGSHTSHIKVELEIDGEYVKDADVLITSDNLLSVAEAVRVLRILYPIYQPVNVTVEEM